MSQSFQMIREKIKNLKGTPGCYLWKNKENEVIYVGKAIRLSERVRSYLNPNLQDVKTLTLQSEIHDLDWIATNSEEEALILEDNLIKKHNPKFNVRLKDDKKYPYICISVEENYPMVFLTRKIKDDKRKYFGPFSDVRATRSTLDLIHKIFPIRKTVQKLPLSTPRRPCLNFHIKRCLAPCQGNVSEKEYQVMIGQVIDFLEGKKDNVEKSLVEQMQTYAEKMEFEKAALIRDSLDYVRKLRQKQTILNQGSGNEDIIAYAAQNDEGQVVVFEIRDGHLDNKKTFAIKGVSHSSETEILSSFLEQYYLRVQIIPTKIILPSHAKADNSFLLEYMQNKFGKKAKIQYPSAGNKKSLLKLAEKNAAMNLTERILATKLRDKSEALQEIKNILQLPKSPQIMECYDISHFQGAQPVASGVQFVDGKPYKKGYRHYKMDSYEGINDPGMMHEVISRRLQRLLNDNEDLPDLIVIDGGFTQLQRACEAAVALGAGQIPMVGLAKKREEIYFPGESVPYSFPKDSPAMRLIRSMRDEAHRFGVTFHRKRRNQNTLKSVLEEMPEIGAVRRKALLKHFAGTTKIEEASLEDLQQVPGIGKKIAEKIFRHMQDKTSEPDTT
ncbi:MAG: excinuclease ABC subunit UvrC [Spirochaetota bacterium]